MFFFYKKIVPIGTIAVAVLGASPGVQAIDSSPSAVVHITAEVVGNTCTPEWTSGSDMEVSLGKVADTALEGVGDVGATIPFTLSLKDCDSGVTKITVTAMGKPDDADATAFANTAPSERADGVAVTLFGGDDQSTKLEPKSTNSVEYEVTDGNAKMTFLAKLVRTAIVPLDGTKDGKVESTATLYMNYD